MLTEITKEWCGWRWVVVGDFGWFLAGGFPPCTSADIYIPPPLMTTMATTQKLSSNTQSFLHPTMHTHTRALNTSKHLLCPHTHTHRHWGVLTAHAHRCSLAYLAINKFSILFFSPQKRKLKAVWGEGAF